MGKDIIFGGRGLNKEVSYERKDCESLNTTGKSNKTLTIKAIFHIFFRKQFISYTIINT